MEAQPHPAQNAKHRGPLRAKASRAQSPSRLGGSLEEVAGQQGLAKTPTFHYLGRQARPEGQAWASVDGHHDLQAWSPAPDGPVQLLPTQGEASPPPDLTQSPLLPAAVGTALGKATEPGTCIPLPGCQGSRCSRSGPHRARLLPVRLAEWVPRYWVDGLGLCLAGGWWPLREAGHPERAPGLWCLLQVTGSDLVVREGQAPCSGAKFRECVIVCAPGRRGPLPSGPGPEQT